MDSLPVQVALGLYLGALTAVVPALVAWSLGFTFKYFTGVTIPGFGVLVLGVAIAGVQGGLLGLLDTQIINSPIALVSALVVMMVTLYAHAQGDKMGAEFPRRFTLRKLRERGLSSDVVERVGQFGQARIRVRGEVADIEGYPPLPDDLRATIREGEWTFPDDLPISELESRLEERLRTDHDLAEATASIDADGRATVSAAPPVGALSRRIPAGKRAVSTDALVPTGLARSDEVTVATPDGDVTGTVVSVRSDGGTAGGRSAGETAGGPPAVSPASGAVSSKDAAPGSASSGNPDSRDAETRPPTAAGSSPRATGGDGRVTVAVPIRAARTLLDADSAAVRVHARGTRREFELLSLLRRDGKRLRRVKIRETGSLASETDEDAALADPEIAVLAVRHGRTWTFAPTDIGDLAAGDELYVVGSPGALDRFEEVVA
ncbi:potassium transporter TrkA [Halorussus amylolyticus]|uniref:potassium transporter TrkA n=1 Tax=Halorussus amylolyticus TaxID=1126242 RepID=UPI00104F7F82|nr:potassium transporter TrkA [Halorussus amylolyticus]